LASRTTANRVKALLAVTPGMGVDQAIQKVAREQYIMVETARRRYYRSQKREELNHGNRLLSEKEEEWLLSFILFRSIDNNPFDEKGLIEFVGFWKHNDTSWRGWGWLH
jgi:hypothetical protein